MQERMSARMSEYMPYIYIYFEVLETMDYVRIVWVGNKTPSTVMYASIYPPAIKHGNGKSSLDRCFSQL